jgi:hypothetical protein
MLIKKLKNKQQSKLLRKPRKRRKQTKKLVEKSKLSLIKLFLKRPQQLNQRKKPRRLRKKLLPRKKQQKLPQKKLLKLKV